MTDSIGLRAGGVLPVLVGRSWVVLFLIVLKEVVWSRLLSIALVGSSRCA